MWGLTHPFSIPPRRQSTRRTSPSARGPHGKRARAWGLGGRPLGIEWLENRSLLTSNPIVTVDTNLGNFQIELRPDVAPQTVANFLSYVASGAYTDTIDRK